MPGLFLALFIKIKADAGQYCQRLLTEIREHAILLCSLITNGPGKRNGGGPLIARLRPLDQGGAEVSGSRFRLAATDGSATTRTAACGLTRVSISSSFSGIFCFWDPRQLRTRLLRRIFRILSPLVAAAGRLVPTYPL